MMNKGNIESEDEIDLVELVKVIWSARIFIIKIVGIFIILGLVIAFTSPVEYEASCKLLPESQDGETSSLGGLSGLAGLAGINLGTQTTGGMSPMLYPEIVQSLPFVLDVMNDTLYFEEEGIYTTSFDYFVNVAKTPLLGYLMKYTIGLPRVIKGWITNEVEIAGKTANQEFYRLSKEEWKLVEAFKERINLFISDETGLITITVEMPDAYAAAQVTRKIEKEVTKDVIAYKTNKAKENLEFVQGTFLDAKVEFEAVQLELARATDQNRNVTSATAQVNLQRIQNEYDVAFEVYKGLASQVEQAKIKLKEETPVFTVLEPVRVPESKSEPKRSLIIVIFGLLGGIFSLLFVIITNWKIIDKK